MAGHVCSFNDLLSMTIQLGWPKGTDQSKQKFDHAWYCMGIYIYHKISDNVYCISYYSNIAISYLFPVLSHGSISVKLSALCYLLLKIEVLVHR